MYTRYRICNPPQGRCISVDGRKGSSSVHRYQSCWCFSSRSSATFLPVALPAASLTTSWIPGRTYALGGVYQYAMHGRNRRRQHQQHRAMLPTPFQGMHTHAGRTTKLCTKAAQAIIPVTPWYTNITTAFHANPIGFMTSMAACVGAIAFAVLLIAAIPALVAFRKTMVATEQLVYTLQDELPDTAAALRLSGLEIADAVEEVSGLGSDLTAGLRASMRTLVSAESGLRDGVAMASSVVPSIKKSLPGAREKAEMALKERAKMTYSDTTVKDVAHATKVATKRLRTVLSAARIAKAASPLFLSSSTSKPEREPSPYDTTAA